jgi:hypothetical protein
MTTINQREDKEKGRFFGYLRVSTPNQGQGVSPYPAGRDREVCGEARFGDHRLVRRERDRRQAWQAGLWAGFATAPERGS